MNKILTAEEFYKDLNKDDYSSEEIRQFLKCPIEQSKIAFAETYHKAKVESITDEEIIMTFNFGLGVMLEKTQEERDNYFKSLGAKWLKQKLLEQ